jgi:signal transduction histidine kinase
MSESKILIVEDDPSLLEGIRAILELDGYHVLSAENGKQALDVLRNELICPDLIVSDIMMPYMDGLELLQAVRQEPKWLAIPFIFLTAKSDKTDMQRGKILGVDDYLVKPFDGEELLIAVEARLKRQRALRNAQADNVNSLKRNILTILNHEFRTPLTFVVAYADMLDVETPSELTEDELLTFLKGVGSGASRLRRLIENFILLVELETGDAERTFEWRRTTISDLPVLLQGLADRVIHTYAPGRVCQLELQPDIPAFVADREYLQIALTQFLSNAFKFSADHQPIVLGAQAENGELHFWVRDFGRGIPPDQLGSIWEIFFQINRDQHEDQGTGSGLAIARGIARLHHGRVQVDSRVHEGSTFSLILPLNRSNA